MTDCTHKSRSWGVEPIGKQWHCPNCGELVRCVDYGEFETVS